MFKVLFNAGRTIEILTMESKQKAERPSYLAVQGKESSNIDLVHLFGRGAKGTAVCFFANGC